MKDFDSLRVGLVASLAALAVAILVNSSQGHAPNRTVLSELRVGQPIALKDNGNSWTITYYQREMPTAYKVAEVGLDYVVVDGIGGVHRETIPIFAIKSVQQNNIPE